MKRYFCHILLVGLIGSFGLNAEQAFGATPLNLNTPPTTISIGTTYDGTVLNLSGQAAAKDEVVVRFVGTPQDLHLKRKGKVFGLLWMNMDSITFTHAPSVFIVGSAKPLTELDSGGTAASDKYQAAALSLDGLQEQMSVKPESADKNTLFHELLKMKREEGLYSELAGIVEYTTSGADQKSFSAHIPLPSRLSPGSYQLEAYAVEDGVVAAKKVYPIQVELTGMPNVMYTMAFDHALLYGLLATIVAILGGLLMAVLFGGSKGAH